MNTVSLRGVTTRIRPQNVFTVLRQWQLMSSSRHALRSLSDHELKDIGMSRLDANAEARRWFWDDAPRGWPAHR